MRQTRTILLAILLLSVTENLLAQISNPSGAADSKRKEKKKEDDASEREAFEFELIKSPKTGKVPAAALINAIRQAKISQQSALIRKRSAAKGSATSIDPLIWMERGPYKDSIGVSNINDRANDDVTAGRTRALCVDFTDPSGKTVWAGSVSGGLWKTTNITVSPANWKAVNDFLPNLSIADICQDPSDSTGNTLYICTGNAFNNSNAIEGYGVFKSTDHGVTWTHLPSTINFVLCTRIICDYLGNVYLGTRGQGLLRSSDGGSSWTSITPSGLGYNICDIELVSTSFQSRMHVTTGFTDNLCRYRYCDNPATVTSSSWRTAATPPGTWDGKRFEISCLNNVLYGLPSDSSNQVPIIYRSIDGGENWTATGGAPPFDWAKSQAWFALAVAINPTDPSQVIVGGLDAYKTMDGGSTWTQISDWEGTTGQYVHADILKILWYDGGDKLLFACDGGVHYSSDQGATIRDRNIGLRVKQFYSIALHPDSVNYFLAGAQDNGVHKLNEAGLSKSEEVTAGDGGYVIIDKNQPTYQFGSYTYSDFKRSLNNGLTWQTISFCMGSSYGNRKFIGGFINRYDYDHDKNYIYGAGPEGGFFRWTTPLTTTAGDYYESAGFPTGATIVHNVSNLHDTAVTAVKVSGNVTDRIYLGSKIGNVVKIDNADTVTSGTPGTDIAKANMPAAVVSCINTGNSDNYIMVSFSSYDVEHVWVTTNGGGGWTCIDGNLPNVPVRWCLFYPGSNTKAIVATDAGVWETGLINGSSTVWEANPYFPVVRTDMIKYRSTDSTFAAATTGRGIFSSRVCSTPPPDPTTTSASRCGAGSVTLSASGGGGMQTDWYDAEISGTLIQSGSATLNTGSLSASKTYYVSARDPLTGCISSNRIPVTAHINPRPALPAALNNSRCGAGTVTISALPDSGKTINWYSSSTAFFPVLSNSNSYTTPSISATTTYYAQSKDTVTGCTSSGKTAVIASIISGLTPPTGINNSRCGTGSISIQATPGVNEYINWYSSATGGSLLLSGSDSLVIYTLSATDTFYAESVRDDWSCISTSRTAVIAGIKTLPAPPTAVNGSRCGAGPVYILGTVTAGNTTDWYSSSSGGSPIVTGNSLYVPNISSTTTYYAASRGIISGCSSVIRTAVTATVNPLPADPAAADSSRCGNGTVTLKATAASGSVVDWYDTNDTSAPPLVSGSSTYTSPFLTATKSYYARARNSTTGCEGNMKEVKALIYPIPLNPTAVNGNRCGIGSVIINAIPPVGHTIDWYAASSGGTALLSSATSYTTPSISTTTNYYAGARGEVSGCISPARTLVVAKVDSVPFPPLPTHASCCDSAVMLICAKAGKDETIDWYAAAGGGAPLLSAKDSFITPLLKTSTTYYSQARNKVTNCLSFVRTPVNASVYPTPAKPMIFPVGPSSFCSGGSVTLKSSHVGSNMWSNGSTSDSILVDSSGVFRVTVSISGCSNSSDSFYVNEMPCSLTHLQVKVFLEGYYDTSGGIMRAALVNSGLSADALEADSIQIELRKSVAPYNVVASAKTILSTNGYASLEFPYTDSALYIVIRHRNSIETWSAAPVTMDSSVSYDFTTSPAKAYGNNLATLNTSHFGIYSGDVNQDGMIESTDYLSVETDVLAILFGYYASDLTGDGVVESEDYRLIENNILKIIFVAKP